jgi:hypothetical protein
MQRQMTKATILTGGNTRGKTTHVHTEEKKGPGAPLPLSCCRTLAEQDTHTTRPQRTAVEAGWKEVGGVVEAY